ncbi:MAG TPA: transketolase C-terminal domain-containing protein [Streptosporangiaceae bacterium]|nr:transketolase C-terminal domain-containing protein [Streptosporangiaceae bacterium]
MATGRVDHLADPGKYRPDDEVREWLARDPLPAYQAVLTGRGFDPAVLDELDDNARAAVDLRSLVPLDTRTILAEVARTGRLFTVEENPRLCGWGAEIVSIVAEEAFGALTGPVIRITTPHIPLPAADRLEDHVLPSVDRIVETVSKAL